MGGILSLGGFLLTEDEWECWPDEARRELLQAFLDERDPSGENGKSEGDSS